MYELSVPKLNSNDVSYLVTGWCYEDGDLVPAGAEVALLETSKAAEGLACGEGGILLREAKVGQECRPGEVIGRLFCDAEEQNAFLDRAPITPATPADADQIITQPALRLMEQYGLDAADFRGLGRKVINRADVQRLLDERLGAQARRYEPSRGQRAVAEMVTLAHRTIPAAHATVSVTVDAAMTALREYSEREAISVRLPELLIRSVADLFARYPLFFATSHDNGEVTLAEEARVGVTIDVGRGLVVPVVDGTAATSLKAIAETLARFRQTALRGRFTEADLSAGNIGISLPAGEVILAQPLIMPRQACMLSLGTIQVVPHLEPDGRLAARQVIYLGLAYDHRLINGREAAAFLADLKHAFESLQRLQALVG
jgi:2-oxoglutarate dehydrogenase E2 component (dihydrolipoamide succinyltransferase)